MPAISSHSPKNAEPRALTPFEARSLRHLAQWFPVHTAVLGRRQMVAVLRHGALQAQRHGLAPEACVRTYTDFMCLLGSGFATDPLLPWAAEALQDPATAADPQRRAERLYDQGWRYLRAVSADFDDWRGPVSDCRFVGALLHLRDLPHEPVSSGLALARTERLLAWLFPAKCAYLAAALGTRVAPDALRAHVERGVLRAAHHGIRGEKGVAAITVLMFLLGDGFDADPLLPWASAALAAVPTQTPTPAGAAREAARVDRLFSLGIAFLRCGWAHAAALAQRPVRPARH